MGGEPWQARTLHSPCVSAHARHHSHGAQQRQRQACTPTMQACTQALQACTAALAPRHSRAHIEDGGADQHAAANPDQAPKRARRAPDKQRQPARLGQQRGVELRYSWWRGAVVACGLCASLLSGVWHQPSGRGEGAGRVCADT